MSDTLVLEPGESVRSAARTDAPPAITMDRVTKRATCAEWGILAYLVADAAAPAGARLTWHGDVSAVRWAVEALDDLA